MLRNKQQLQIAAHIKPGIESFGRQSIDFLQQLGFDLRSINSARLI